MPATQKMKVNVIDALSRAGPAIGDNAEPILSDPLVTSDLGSRGKNIADELSVSRLQIQEGGDVLARNDQDMNRGLRVNIFEGDDGTVLVDHTPLDLAFDDSAKKAIHLFTLPS